jgi:hypothetical protein
VFKRETIQNRLKLVRKKGLCNNCLFNGHIARSCPKESFCKVSGCQAKHSTFLHPKNVNRRDEKSLDEQSTEANDKETNQTEITGAQNGYVNTNNSRCDVIGAGVTSTGLAIVPVKVKCRNSDKTIVTYAFLWLLKQLGAKGEETTLSLTTIQHENSPTECLVVNLEVFDLEENNIVDLPYVFSTSKLPVVESSIPKQADVDIWSHLKDIQITRINASIGLLICNDAPRALEPK